MSPRVENVKVSEVRSTDVQALVSQLTDRRRINVQRNAVMVSRAILVGTPKSHESRSVPYPRFLADQLELCRDKKRSDLLFGDGTNLIRPPDFRNGWLGARDRSVTRD